MLVFVEDCRYPDRVTHATGYAEVQRQIILGLSQLGVAVGFPPCHRELEGARLIPPAQRDALLSLARPRSGGWDVDTEVVHLQVASPDGFKPRAGRLTVGLTMTERETLGGYPFDWVACCNAVDAIVTPTHWNRRVFEAHGIRNVHVAPLGVDCEFFVPRPVRFLSVAAGFGWPGSRANWEDLAACYRTEFEGVTDVGWTIVSLQARSLFKYGDVRHAARQFPGDLVEWARGLVSNAEPRIDVVDGGTLTGDELRDIYQTHDCFLSYSREGWGLPLLEAMACGLDLIVSDYGAPMEFLSGSPARIFGGGRPREDNLRLVGGDLPALRAHMRSLYEQKRKTRQWAESFAWARMVPRLKSLLGDLHTSWRRTRARG